MNNLHYVGQRLCLKNQCLTVQYVGLVEGKSGEWLGVEWDDPKRGKHNGEHKGRRYFQCRSISSTAASFLRPNQPWDQPRSFMEALREKYIDANQRQDDTIVYVSGKQAEEVGFDKFARRQRELRGIHVLVLDRMRIRHDAGATVANEGIQTTCAEITELNISGNLFETFSEVQDLCERLPKLKTLTLDGNRFQIDEAPSSLANIRALNLSSTRIPSEKINTLLTTSFPTVQSMACIDNEWTDLSATNFPPQITSLDLSSNNFTTLSSISPLLTTTSNLTALLLRENKISSVGGKFINQHVTSLDLSHNAIPDLKFFDTLQQTFPSLLHLRTTGNPIITSSRTCSQDTDGGDREEMKGEELYILTLARLPTLKTLNYSTITDKERLNAESYYLGQIARELVAALSSASFAELGDDEEARGKKRKEIEEGVLQRHRRWKELCEEYGEPAILSSHRSGGGEDADPSSKTEYAPGTLGSKLVDITFCVSPSPASTQQQNWVQSLPQSFSIYTVLGIVGKKLGIMPLLLRLVWETGERDPVALEAGTGEAVEWWDSEEEEDDEPGASINRDGGGEWVEREVELVAGTRALGTYIEGKEARMRVEIRGT